MGSPISLGSTEAWVDMRKYHYDIRYSGDYPKLSNGWSETMIDQKWDTDESKVYKGFYLAPAQVQGRKGQYNTRNYGSPCFRVRPPLQLGIHVECSLSRISEANQRHGRQLPMLYSLVRIPRRDARKSINIQMNNNH